MPAGRDEAFEELTPLHHDVGGAVAPGRLQPESERAIGALLEPVVRERGTPDVMAESLEAAAVVCRYGDAGVQAHAAELRHARRCGCALLAFSVAGRFDAIAEPSLRLASMRAGGDPGSQRGGGQQREQRFVAGDHVAVVARALLEHEPDLSGGTQFEPRPDLARRAPCEGMARRRAERLG